MVPTAYHSFFSACASVAGTLIGLLFVAISVSPHKDVGATAPLAFQIQAAVAFTTLINALVIALAAVLPGENLGTAAVILSCAGLSSTIGMTVVSLRDRPGRHHYWGLAIIPMLGILYILQLNSGIHLLRHPRNPSPVHFEALLAIIFFMVAIARAWHMIGARDTHLLAVVSGLVRARRETPPTTPQTSVVSTSDVTRRDTSAQPCHPSGPRGPALGSVSPGAKTGARP